MSCLIVAGGWFDPAPNHIATLSDDETEAEDYDRKEVSYVEVITDTLGTQKLPNLPEANSSSSMVMHNGTILLCGGRDENMKKCLQFFH